VQDLLVATAQLAPDERPHLLLVGDGVMRDSLEALAARLGIDGTTSFAGAQTDTLSSYRSMDVLVLPSYEEGFPMVLLEALACGVPVIATRVGDVPRLVEPGDTGWLLEPGDVSGLAAALREARAAGTGLPAMGARGRELVVRRYSSRHMAAQYLDAYRLALDSRASGRR
jgi:glycosyltransferase involved in cell wall biosynthesis